MDGDWNRRPRDGYVDYVCPHCETTLTSRPSRKQSEPRRATPTQGRRRRGLGRGRSAPRPSAAWQRTLHATVQVWRASLGIGVSGIAAILGPSVGPPRR
ncbi:hypothetical protein C493_21776 [Natronolimnohabitans innermongolicus JCM 12255]|uniref:DUF8106 domain-containing protein n=1 Tax=Natronolimnohabitans innermongolicus JCM 12255 TaxID=1227499 RepID=L9WH29_9EURY|nr:hypothetical protein C493_21776 [Natronolimnohabitans innermongolicus JCM 12255]